MIVRRQSDCILRVLTNTTELYKLINADMNKTTKDILAKPLKFWLLFKNNKSKRKIVLKSQTLQNSTKTSRRTKTKSYFTP